MMRRFACFLGLHSMRWCPSDSEDVMVCRHCEYMEDWR